MEDSAQNSFCRLVSCGKLISFSCKQVSSVNESERSELLFSRLSFKKEDNSFLNEASGVAVITRTKTAHVAIVNCKCVLHFQKRAILPCILVTKTTKKAESFQYSLLVLSTSNQLEPCFKYKLPYQIKGKVSILEGPTVMWSHAGHVWFTSLQAGEVRQIPIQLSHTVVGELPLHKGSFALGLQSISESDQATTSKTCGYFVQHGQVFDGSVVLPHPYISITCCILVLSAEKADAMLKTSAVVATSNQQLLYVENSVVKDVCQLPFMHPEDIQLVNTGRNGSLFIISFNEGHVCAVWKENFHIASEWSGVSSVHVDDFLSFGTEQMLLIFAETNATSQPLGNFLITDLCGISYSTGPANEPLEPSSVQQDNYLFTIKALETRLQSGLTLLQELQKEERVKERVVQQSLQALTSDKKLDLTQHEQESLVALWDCNDESKEEILDHKMQDELSVSSNPQVDKLWHRVIRDRMVVGVILTTDNPVPVASGSLFILTEMGQSSMPAVIRTQSQVFWLPMLNPSTSPSSPSTSSCASLFTEPSAKRSKQHSAGTNHDLNTCRLAVTAVAEVTPLLNSGCVKCHVMLHYIQRHEAFASVSNPTPTVLRCGQVTLNIHNDFQTQLLARPELKTDEAQEDLLSLMAVLDHWVFHIHSPDYSLGDIVGWIQKRVGCKRIEVSPQYLLMTSAGPSALMLLRWHQITPFQGELSVHSSQLQMLQFLDSLLAYVPMSCTVESVKAIRGQNEAQTFSLALEKEAVSLRDCVSSLLCKNTDDDDNRRMSSSITLDLRSEEGLQRYRAEWQRNVERSQRNLSPLVDVQRYRESTQSLIKVQLDGDLEALLETQKTLFS